MSKYSPRITGFDIDRMERLAKRASNKRLLQSAETVANVIKLDIGQRYPPASEAGTPPHLRNGDLQRSVSAKLVKDGEAEINIDAPYSTLLEKGTSKMAARPFAVRALKQCRDLFSEIEEHE